MDGLWIEACMGRMGCIRAMLVMLALALAMLAILMVEGGARRDGDVCWELFVVCCTA